MFNGTLFISKYLPFIGYIQNVLTVNFHSIFTIVRSSNARVTNDHRGVTEEIVVYDQRGSQSVDCEEKQASYLYIYSIIFAIIYNNCILLYMIIIIYNLIIYNYFIIIIYNYIYTFIIIYKLYIIIIYYYIYY